MKDDFDDRFEIETLRDEVASLKSSRFWIGVAFAIFVFLVVISGLGILALPFLLIGGGVYVGHRFLRGLVVRRARINERLAPRRPRRSRLFGFRRAG
jgi:hypothetical protein